MSPAGQRVPMQVGDDGPNHGVIVDVLPGDVYVEVVAFIGRSLGQCEVHVYTVGPRGGRRYVQLAHSLDELRAAADMRSRAADSAGEYLARVVRTHAPPSPS